MAHPIEQRSPADFPLLSQIPDPPATLYLRGSYPSSEHTFLCVVGSRKYTPYGKALCERLITGLAGYPVVIISGLALGIDAIAHEAALAAGLATVAIPGSGLNESVLYPRSNVQLAHRILEEGGALLSEFEPSYRPALHSFAQRNRIMAGLSHAVLIVEAEVRSGTLITARLAMEYNRDVLAVPGPLTSSTSQGPHYLIRNGAALIRDSGDILEALGMNPRDKTTIEHESLSPQETRIVELLRNPTPRDELALQAKLPASELNVILSTLELKGLVKEELGVLRLA